MVEKEKKLRMVQDKRTERMIYISQKGRMVDDERMGRWCREIAEKFVVDAGMKRIVEKEKKLRMVQDED